MPVPTSRRSLRFEPLEDRLTPTAAGSLDPTFGIGGRVVIPSASAVAVEADGKILVTGGSPAGSPG